MKKTLLILTLATVLLLAFSAIALADAADGVWVNGHPLKPGEYYLNGDFTDNAANPGGNAFSEGAISPYPVTHTGTSKYYNFYLSEDGKKLTLWDAVITEVISEGENRVGLYTHGVETIVLKGDNVISLNGDYGVLGGIVSAVTSSDNTVTIKGDPNSSLTNSLSINVLNAGGASVGIETTKSLTIDDVDLSINVETTGTGGDAGDAIGLDASGAVTLTDMDAAINAKSAGGKAVGIGTTGGIDINDANTAVSIVAEGEDAFGIHAISSNVIINGASVEAVVMQGEDCFGIFSDGGSVTVRNNAHVKALVKGAGYAIAADGAVNIGTSLNNEDKTEVIAAVNGDDSYAILANYDGIIPDPALEPDDNGDVNISGAAKVDASMKGDISEGNEHNIAAIYGMNVNIKDSALVTAVASGVGWADDATIDNTPGYDANDDDIIDEKLGFTPGTVYSPAAICATDDINITGTATINATADSHGYAADVAGGTDERTYTYEDDYYNYGDPGDYATRVTEDHPVGGTHYPETNIQHTRQISIRNTPIDNTFYYIHNSKYYTGGAYAILAGKDMVIGDRTNDNPTINATVNLDKWADGDDFPHDPANSATAYNVEEEMYNHYNYCTTYNTNTGYSGNNVIHSYHDYYYHFNNQVVDHHFESGALYAKGSLTVMRSTIDAVNTGIGGVAVGADGPVTLKELAEVTASAFGEGYRGQVYNGYEYDPTLNYGTDNADVDARDPVKTGRYEYDEINEADIMPTGIRSVDEHIVIDGAKVIAVGAGPNYEYDFEENEWINRNTEAFGQAGYGLWAYDGAHHSSDNAIYVATDSPKTFLYATGLKQALFTNPDTLYTELETTIRIDGDTYTGDDQLISLRGGGNVNPIIKPGPFDETDLNDTLIDTIISLDETAVTRGRIEVSGFCVLNTWDCNTATLNYNGELIITNVDSEYDDVDDYLLIINSNPGGEGISSAALTIDGDVDVTVASTRRDSNGTDYGNAIEVRGSLFAEDADAIRAITRGVEGVGIKADHDIDLFDCDRVNAVSLDGNAVDAGVDLVINGCPSVNAVTMGDARQVMRGSKVNIAGSNVQAINLGEGVKEKTGTEGVEGEEVDVFEISPAMGIYSTGLGGLTITDDADDKPSKVLALVQGDTSVAIASVFSIDIEERADVQALALGLENELGNEAGDEPYGAIIALGEGEISPLAITDSHVDAVAMADNFGVAIMNCSKAVTVWRSNVHALALGDGGAGIYAEGELAIKDSTVTSLAAGDVDDVDDIVNAALFSQGNMVIENMIVEEETNRKSDVRAITTGNGSGAVGAFGDLTVTKSDMRAYALDTVTDPTDTDDIGGVAAIWILGDIAFSGSDIFGVANGGQTAIAGMSKIDIDDSTVVGVVNGQRAEEEEEEELEELIFYAAIMSMGPIEIDNSGTLDGQGASDEVVKGISTSVETAGIYASLDRTQNFEPDEPLPGQEPEPVVIDTTALTIKNAKVIALTSEQLSMGILTIGDIKVNNYDTDEKNDVIVATWGVGATGIFAAAGKIEAGNTQFDIRTYEDAYSGESFIELEEYEINSGPSNGMMSWRAMNLNRCALVVRTEGDGLDEYGDHGACGLATVSGDIKAIATDLNIDTWGKYACGICAMDNRLAIEDGDKAGSVYLSACVDVDIYTRGHYSDGIHGEDLVRIGGKNSEEAACVVKIKTEGDESPGILGESLFGDDADTPSVQIFDSTVNIETGLLIYDEGDEEILLQGLNSHGIEGGYYIEIDHSDIKILTWGGKENKDGLVTADGIYSQSGKVYIYEESELDIVASGDGIYAKENITVQNSSGSISAGIDGIHSEEGNISIKDESDLDILAMVNGIMAIMYDDGKPDSGGDVLIQNSEVDIQALKDGVVAYNSVDVVNSVLNTNSLCCGIEAIKKEVNISDNSVVDIRGLVDMDELDGLDPEEQSVQMLERLFGVIGKYLGVNIDGIDLNDLTGLPDLMDLEEADLECLNEADWERLAKAGLTDKDDVIEFYAGLVFESFFNTMQENYLSANGLVDVGITSYYDSVNISGDSLVYVEAASAGIWAEDQVNMKNDELSDEDGLEDGYDVVVKVAGSLRTEGEGEDRKLALVYGHGIVAGDYEDAGVTVDGVGDINIENIRLKIRAQGKGVVNGWHWDYDKFVYGNESPEDGYPGPDPAHQNDITITDSVVNVVSGSDGIQAMEGRITTTETELEVESFGPEADYDHLNPDYFKVGVDENGQDILVKVRAMRARDGLIYNYNPLKWYMAEGTPKSAAQGVKMFTVVQDGDEYITVETYIYASHKMWVPMLPAGKHFPFQDVTMADWFYQDVWNCWDVKLINGMTPTMFMPYDNLTYAQAIKLAACMNQWKADGAVSIEVRQGVDWYKPYVEYAELHQIIEPGQFAGVYNNKIDRYNFGMVFAKALPDAAYTPINIINSIPDVPESSEFYPYIFKLYSAGIVIGVDAQGNFNGATFINRAEVSAITNRMINPDSRKTVSL